MTENKMRIEVGSIQQISLEENEAEECYLLYAKTNRFSHPVLIGTYTSFLEATQEFTVWHSAMKLQNKET